MIPLCAPHLRIRRYGDVVRNAIDRVINGTQYVLGHEVEAFEHDFATFLGANYCISVNSGTDALTIGLRALGVMPGDEIITASMTFAGTALAILHVGASPRFVDVDPRTRCICVDEVEAAITPRTAAIVPVHLHGYPADMRRLMAVADRHGLAVLEDCAQAHGARIAGRHVGTWGHVGAFSFYPTKNLGCIGDGGAIVTQDPSLAAQIRSLRQYGWRDHSRITVEVGYNSRLDEIQAAVLSALLPYVDEGNRERAEHARHYFEHLGRFGVDLPAQHGDSVYHQFAIALDNRDGFQRYLSEKEGLETGVHYANPLHCQPAFSAYASKPLPVTEDLAARMVSIPIQPEVIGIQRNEIVAKIVRGLQACQAS